MASEKIILWEHVTLVFLAIMDSAISHVMPKYTNDKNEEKCICTQTFYLLIAALYDIIPNVEIRLEDEPGKVYLRRINITQWNKIHKFHHFLEKSKLPAIFFIQYY